MTTPIDKGHEHTNRSMRQLLGEAGFICSGYIRGGAGDNVSSVWIRGTDKIVLREYFASKVSGFGRGKVPPPKLFEHPANTPDQTEKEIDPKMLGVRNPNLQTGEGR